MFYPLGFPLSRKFQHFKLSYAARELACFGREQFLKRLDDSIVGFFFRIKPNGMAGGRRLPLPHYGSDLFNIFF
jgi:hypothetical protein